MRKSSLRKVPVSELNDGHLGNMKLNPKCRNFILAAPEVADGTQVLVINLFQRACVEKGQLVPSFRTFLWRDDYLSQEIGGKERWFTGTLNNILWQVYGVHDDPALLDMESLRAIAGFLGCDESNVLRALGKYQSGIVDGRLNERYANILSRIDERMRGIPELPKGFARFIDRKIVKDRFLFYAYEKGKRQQKAFCTACERDVTLDSTKHGSTAKCPNCGAIARMKAVVKTGKSLCVKGRVGIIQRTPAGAMVRLFSFAQDYPEYHNPKVNLREYARLLLLKNGKLEEYEYGIYPPNSGYNRWKPNGQDGFEFYNAPMYPYREASVFKGSSWTHMNVKLYSQSLVRKEGYLGESTSHHKFLRAAAKFPQIEYLHKMGLRKLIGDLTFQKGEIVNPSGKSPSEFLGLNRQHTALLQSINGGLTALKVLQQAQAQGRTLSTDEGTFFVMMADELVSNEKAVLAMKYATPHKIMRFIRERIMPVENVTVSDWIDYVEACEKLKYDLSSDFVLFPKNVKEAHDNTMARVTCGNLENEEKAYGKLFKQYERVYSYAPLGSEFRVIVPESLYQIVREGHSLRHCVTGYAKRVADGETKIFFVRRRSAPEDSFFTLEVRDNKVFQCRGYGNCSMSDDVKHFINEYENVILRAAGFGGRRRKAG